MIKRPIKVGGKGMFGLCLEDADGELLDAILGGALAVEIIRAVNNEPALVEALRKIEKMPWVNSEAPYAIIARDTLTELGYEVE